MKETFWSKLRELWAIRQRCQQIKLQQRQDRLLRPTELSASFPRQNSRQATNLPARFGSTSPALGCAASQFRLRLSSNRRRELRLRSHRGSLLALLRVAKQLPEEARPGYEIAMHLPRC